MSRIAVLTPAPGETNAALRWPDVFDRNAAPLRAAGMTVEPRSWTDAQDLAAFDLVLALLAWGYPQAVDLWRERVAQWQRSGVRLMNPASVLLWNADKSYLGRLGERGAPVVPACYVDRVSEAAMAEAAVAFDAGRLVAKPRVSASAWRTIRWSSGEPIDNGPPGPALIQPFLPDIEIGGELSLFYFSGCYSHAVRKRPQPGDFRVQPEFAAIITPHNPTPDEFAAAGSSLAAVDEPLLYARLDLVRGSDGRPLLIELEAIEPDLYLEHDPGGGRLFAQAIAACCADATAGR